MSTRTFADLTKKVNGLNLSEVAQTVDAYSKEKNVSSTVYPSAAPKDEKGAGATIETVTTLATPKAKAARKAALTKRLGIDMPDYLFTEIGKDALKKGVTKRAVVLQALRTAGYDIDDIDLVEDGRRAR
jgi:hypothetical protein